MKTIPRLLLFCVIGNSAYAWCPDLEQAIRDSDDKLVTTLLETYPIDLNELGPRGYFYMEIAYMTLGTFKNYPALEMGIKKKPILAIIKTLRAFGAVRYDEKYLWEALGVGKRLHSEETFILENKEKYPD